MINRINSYTELRDWICYESKYYNNEKKLTFFLKGLLGFEKNVIWKFQKTLRYTEYHKNCNHKIRYIIYRGRLNKLQNKTGLRISENVFGKGLHIMHLGPILTNGNVRAGENLVLHVNTAIVANGHSGKCPIIGDNVIVSVGAVIMGDIYIADRIVIGANAVVNKTFNEKSIAIAGQPARKISDNGSESWHKEKNLV